MELKNRMNNNEPYKKIVKDFDNDSERIEQCLSHIAVRQQELLATISTIQAANQQLELQVASSKDPKDKGKLYSIITRNISLLAEIYTCYQSFETTRHKYMQDLGRTVKDKHHMLEIELRSLEEKFNSAKTEEVSDMVSKLKEVLSGISIDNVKKITTTEAPEYSMT